MSAVPSTSSTSLQYTYSNGTYFPTPFHLQQQPPTQALLLCPFNFPVLLSILLLVLSRLYTLPQLQQARMQITPEALENLKAALVSSEMEHKAEAKKKVVPRKAAGQSWEDLTLAEWQEYDYRLFCGNLGNEVNDDVLSKAFSRFPTFNIAKVVRDKQTGENKGYGFVSFSNPLDLAAAFKEINGKYVGNCSIILHKSIEYKALESSKNGSHKKPKLAKKSISEHQP